MFMKNLIEMFVEEILAEDVRRRGNKWCAYVDDKLTKKEKEANPKKYKGKKVGSVQRTKSGKIRMKARACAASKKKANNIMAAAMMESGVSKVDMGFEDWWEIVKQNMAGEPSWSPEAEASGAEAAYIDGYTPDEFEEEWLARAGLM